MSYQTYDEINEVLDAYEAEDGDRDEAIENLLAVYDEATPEQREYIASSASEWVRG